MKRCPRCSFIYEDDQHLCDLDGGELVFASGMLPPPDTAASTAPVAQVKSRRRGLVFLPLAGVLLAAVLILIYSAVPQRAALPSDNQPSTTTALPATRQPDPTTTQAPTPTAPTPPPAAPANNTQAIRRTAPMPRLAKVDARPPAPKREEKTSHPVAASAQQESKLGSILKKTGRLFKKPFKL
ncbi:MAG: hypothetical protein ACJ741_20410 [Pyrinomonadaceae bacterium]